MRNQGPRSLSIQILASQGNFLGICIATSRSSSGLRLGEFSIPSHFKSNLAQSCLIKSEQRFYAYPHRKHVLVDRQRTFHIAPRDNRDSDRLFKSIILFLRINLNFFFISLGRLSYCGKNSGSMAIRYLLNPLIP